MPAQFSSPGISPGAVGQSYGGGLESFVQALLSSQQQAQQMQAQKQQMDLQKAQSQQQAQLFPLELQQKTLELQKEQRDISNTLNLSDTAKSLGFGKLLPAQYSKITYGLDRVKDVNQTLIGLVPLEDKQMAANILSMEQSGKSGDAEKSIKQ